MEKSDLEIELRSLYDISSKHSQYQQLPTCLSSFLDLGNTTIKPTYERERLDFVLSKIDLGKDLLDIGGNSGFFSFEAIDHGVKSVDYWEGNTSHAKFVKLAAQAIGYDQRIKVYNDYFDFSRCDKHYDTIFLFNVIHHLGFDFSSGIDMHEAKALMINSLNNLAAHGNKMVFQMGFNWGGDTSRCLFTNGLKSEVIDFVSDGTKDYWIIESIGIPELVNDKYIYRDLTPENSNRFDEFGEFLNRPLFIMKSKALN